MARRDGGNLSERGDNMKTRTIILTVVTCFAGLTLGFAQNPNLGTWKLNEAKSKLSPGAPKNNTVAVESAGDSMKVTIDGVDGQGKPFHNEWTGKFDGKDYPLSGDPMWDSRSYKKTDDHTTELASKKDGKVTMTGHLVVSADGKTRTVTTSGTDPMGMKIHSTAVYDKQ
jgi:hypothetical protein